MGARGGKATAGNGGSRKNYHDHIAETQTNSHCRPWSIGYSQGLTRQGRAAAKGKTAGVNRRPDRETSRRSARGGDALGLQRWDTGADRVDIHLEDHCHQVAEIPGVQAAIAGVFSLADEAPLGAESLARIRTRGHDPILKICSRRAARRSAALRLVGGVLFMAAPSRSEAGQPVWTRRESCLRPTKDFEAICPNRPGKYSAAETLPS